MEGRRFFPLDQKLRLRKGKWSEGAAELATDMAMYAPSFAKAAKAYRKAVGSAMTRMSVWRMAISSGCKLARQKAAEAEKAVSIAQREARPGSRVLTEERPVEGQGNLSTDGTMVRIREEGWKEARMSTVSHVEVLPPKGTRPGKRPSRRDHELRVRLDQHSYVLRLCDADEFAPYQYAEGLRRALDRVEILTSVNDGALWIKRITQTNFPKARQIVDWAHASGYLHKAGKVVWGEVAPEGKQWVQARLDELWNGQVEKVLEQVHKLDLHPDEWSEDVGNIPGYFEANVDRMRYDQYRASGYPIGSGTVESGANNVVHARMNRPGRGWARKHANAMLALLGEYHSDRFEQTWEQLCRSVT